jgi:predicted DNA-binding transcriptional regulator AlpA
MNDKFRNVRKLTCRALTERYGVVYRTIDRWVATGVLPEPMRINKIRYWDLGELEEFERKRKAQAGKDPQKVETARQLTVTRLASA